VSGGELKALALFLRKGAPSRSIDPPLEVSVCPSILVVTVLAPFPETVCPHFSVLPTFIFLPPDLHAVKGMALFSEHSVPF